MRFLSSSHGLAWIRYAPSAGFQGRPVRSSERPPFRRRGHRGCIIAAELARRPASRRGGYRAGASETRRGTVFRARRPTPHAARQVGSTLRQRSLFKNLAYDPQALSPWCSSPACRSR